MKKVMKKEQLKEYIKKRIKTDMNGCWIWQLAIRKSNGYSICNILFESGRRMFIGHRLAYEVFVGEIPNGLTIDHLCKNKACVNPEHLEAVPLRVNLQRYIGSTETHCKMGHEYTKDNTIVYKTRGVFRGRACRKCCNSRVRRLQSWKVKG